MDLVWGPFRPDIGGRLKCVSKQGIHIRDLKRKEGPDRRRVGCNFLMVSRELLGQLLRIQAPLFLSPNRGCEWPIPWAIHPDIGAGNTDKKMRHRYTAVMGREGGIRIGGGLVAISP